MDKVANTAGTYYAYLKTWYRKARRPFRFELLSVAKGKTGCRSFLCEAKKLVSMRSYDILYLDPPYNERSYWGYYHLPETIASEGKPAIRGKSGIPLLGKLTSDFNKPHQARDAFMDLLKVARFKLLAFHYSDDGLITPKEIRKILAPYGKIERYVLKSRGYTTEKVTRAVDHRLYLVSRA